MAVLPSTWGITGGGRWILPRVLLRWWILTALMALVVDAEKDSNPYPWGDNPNNHAFRMYWNDARNVLQDLDKFQSLYIKYHGCVWSECSRGDSFDDDGENRDGDEYWYQYRTQPFCANAAYSLYGVLKNHFWQINHCSRATYINSFFTYGGADTLLEALNKHVKTVFDEKNYNNNYNNNNNNYDDHSNSVCYAVEDEQRNRELNSQDNNNNNDDGISSTMGCSTRGNFVVALFEGSTCDGNYYLGTSDSSDSDMSKYNRKINGVRCGKIWNRLIHSSGAGTYNRRRLQELPRQLEDQNKDDDNDDGYYETYNSPAEYLLSHSWACDVSLYPNGLCPDPYGLKNKYDAVLQAVASGRPAKLAVWQVRLHSPLIFLSTVMFLAACALLGLTYFVSNRDEAKKLGTWRPIVGRDLSYFFRSTVPKAFRKLWRMFRHCCRACLRLMPFEMRRRRNSTGEKDNDDVEDPSRATSRSRRSSSRRKQRSSRSNATSIDDELDDKKRRHSSRRRGGKDVTDDEMAARRPSSRRRGEEGTDESNKGERPSSRRRGEEPSSTRSSKRSLRSSKRGGKQQDDDDDADDDGNLSPTSTSPKRSRRRDRYTTTVDPPDNDDGGDGNFVTPYMSYFGA